MKKIFLILPGSLLALLLVIMVVGTAFGQTAGKTLHNAASFVDEFCFNGEVSKMDVSDLVNKYTDKTNQFFNEKIAYIMTNPNTETPSINLDDYDTKGGGLCQDDQGNAVKDQACQSIALCKDNATPYCVGITLLGFSPERYKNYDDNSLENYNQLQYSYFCFKAALDKKRNEIYDSTPQAILAKCDNGSEFADEKICKLKVQIASETDSKKLANLQRDLEGELKQKRWWSNSAAGALSSATASIIDLTNSSVERVKFIDEEESRAKQALDQTLDAYSQLRSAWTMHVKYMDTFAELVKYRDNLAAIRKQTDAFPFKFIDATTTKCL